MSEEQIKQLIENVVAGNLTMSYTQSVVVTLVMVFLGFWGAYFGSYFQTKGKNLATKEDISDITDKIENVKAEYAKQLEELKAVYSRELEDYKFEQRRIEQSAKVAEFLAKEVYGEKSGPEQEHWIRLAWELSLYLPADICMELAECVVKNNPDPKEILCQIRKLIHGDEDKLQPNHILHLQQIRNYEIKRVVALPEDPTSSSAETP